MKKPLKFYYDLLSPPSRALFIFFQYNKIQCEKIPVALRFGEHLTDEYKENVNRFGKVPCINDNGFKLSESGAIFRYLSKELMIEDHWYPNNSKLRARVDEYLSWSHNNIRLNAGIYFFTQWVNPIRTQIPSDPKNIVRCKQQLNISLDEMENIWLKNDKYITGSKITIADVFGAADIQQPLMCGFDPLENRPKLQAWLEEVKKNLNPEFDEAHKYIYQYAKKYNGNPPINQKV